jgi:hypothetical protein
MAPLLNRLEMSTGLESGRGGIQQEWHMKNTKRHGQHPSS